MTEKYSWYKAALRRKKIAEAKTNQTSGDPGNGYIIWNNATQASATQLLISDVDNNGNNTDIFLSNIPSGSIVVIQDKTTGRDELTDLGPQKYINPNRITKPGDYTQEGINLLNGNL